MKNKITLIVILIFLSPLSYGLIVPVEDYDFPIKSRYIASLTSEALPSCELGLTKVKTEIQNPAREEKNYNFYLSTVSTNAKKALILFTGLGSDENSNLTKWITCAANKMNIDVYIAPNSFTSYYARKSSYSGMPGEPSKDAVEMLEYILQLKNSLAYKAKTYESVASIGYSHGGLLNAHILKVAHNNRIHLFDHSLLLNPPLDLYHGVQTLDDLAINHDVSLIKAASFMIKLKKWRKKQSKDFKIESFYTDFQKDFDMDESHATAFVAKAFQRTVAPVLKQVLRSYDHPDEPALPPRRSATYRHAKVRWNQFVNSINYTKYLEMFIKPFQYGASTSTQHINNGNSFYGLINYLTGSSKVRIITNADDFLVKDENDLLWLENQFQQLAIIYPKGGHLGNIGHPHNMSELTSWLTNGHFTHE